MMKKMYSEQANMNPILELFYRFKNHLLDKIKGKTPEQIKSEKWTQKNQELALRKYLRQKGLEQVKIDQAKHNWTIVRKKLKVLNMIRYIGEDAVKEMYGLQLER